MRYVKNNVDLIYRNTSFDMSIYLEFPTISDYPVYHPAEKLLYNVENLMVHKPELENLDNTPEIPIKGCQAFFKDLVLPL